MAGVHVSGPGPPSHTSPTKLALPSTSRNQARDAESRKEKKIGHRRVTEEGTVTYKKKPTSELQGAIQLGIQHHIGSLQQKPDRDLLYGDFNIIDTVNFPREGTKTTQAHPYSDFRFRIYAPVAFRCFRKSYKLDIRDFLNSLCSQSLQELSNPGASGSIFYISQDDEFIIKTVQHKEGEFLQKLLPEYFMNLMQHPRTLLPKYYGLYCYQSGHKNIRFVVMNNLLPSSVRIHEKYDLKGSTYGRQASDAERAKSSPTLKDLDFIENHPDGIWLEAETYDALLKTIERDCLVLKSFRIMDYSLLLGIHNLDQAKRERLARKQASEKQTTVNQRGDESSDLSPNSIPKMKSNGLISHISNKSNGNNTNQSSSPSNDVGSGGLLGAVNESSNKTSPSPNGSQLPTRHAHFTSGVDDETKTPNDHNTNNDEDDKSVFQRGVHKSHSQKRVVAYCTAMESIKASAEPVELESEERELIPSGGIPARDTNGDRLLLYIGVIDILQSYRILKKMEHGFKSLVADGKTISVTHPLYYAQRFQEFIGRTVFRRIQSPQAAFALKQSTSKRLHRPMAAIKTLDDTIDLADKGTTYESGKSTDVSPLYRSDRNNSTQTLLYHTSFSNISFTKSDVWCPSKVRSCNGTYSRKNSYLSSSSKQPYAIRSKLGSNSSNIMPITKMPNRYRSTGELNRRISTPESSISTMSSDNGQGSITGNNYSRRFKPQSGYRSTTLISSSNNNQRIAHFYDILASDFERTPSQISFSTSSSSDKYSHTTDKHTNDSQNNLLSSFNKSSYYDHNLLQIANNQPESCGIIQSSHQITSHKVLPSNNNNTLKINNESSDSINNIKKRQSNRFSQIDCASLEKFMNDASSTLSSPIYDPYGMAFKIPSWSSSSSTTAYHHNHHQPYNRRHHLPVLILDKQQDCPMPSSRSSIKSSGSTPRPVPILSESFIRKRQCRKVN
ncbi:unnamed protein product [Schistosoma rodhaini]|uniref:PIPK domain-containing protein n=1 Tax=Schistosoma rodhaini TaxID=6188 RepID=A0AA85EUK9_9TREM|nr:unnamed protein product [Schistosoma rodhaini]